MRLCPSCGSRFSNDARYCPIDGQPTDEVPDERPAADPLLGTVVDGRYRVERAIGEGGMGVVYATTHVALQKRFALKVLRGDMSKDQEVVQRFVQEAQASSAIGHPNIVDISDFGRLPDGTFYFVMEYLDGESLTDRILRTNGMPAAEAIPILEMLTSALGAAHDRGIVHRDLKPDNIFLVRRGPSTNFVKVLDFGIAKVGGAASKLTRTGMIFGTPHYMSPEQAAGQAVDRRTDVYALGVIMYEMVTGRVPFDADTFMGILSKHMFEAPPRPTDVATGQDLGALEPIILRALVKKPEERYQSMEAVHRDLMTVSHGGRIESFTPSANVMEFRASSPTMPDLRPSSTTSSLLPGRTNLSYLVVGGAALLALGGIGGTALHFLDASRSGDHVVIQAPLVAPPASGIVAIAPAVPPAHAPSTAVAAPVRIESAPIGASVFSGESIIGTTPLDLPRPSGEAVSVDVRLDGFRSQTVQVSSTSQSPLVVRLEASGGSRRDDSAVHAATTPNGGRVAGSRTSGERSPGTNSTRNPTTTHGATEPPTRTPTTRTEPARPPPSRMPPDVLDPWQ